MKRTKHSTRARRLPGGSIEVTFVWVITDKDLAEMHKSGDIGEQMLAKRKPAESRTKGGRR